MSSEHLPKQVFHFWHEIHQISRNQTIGRTFYHQHEHQTGESLIYFSPTQKSFNDVSQNIFYSQVFMCSSFLFVSVYPAHGRTRLGMSPCSLWVVNKEQMKAWLPPTVWLKSCFMHASDLLGKSAFCCDNLHCCTVLMPVGGKTSCERRAGW